MELFTDPPERINPLDLIEWAMICGQWHVEISDLMGIRSWVGPAGSRPVIGTELMSYRDRDTALSTMKSQYQIWWSQKCVFKEALGLLQNHQYPIVKQDDSGPIADPDGFFTGSSEGDDEDE